MYIEIKNTLGEVIYSSSGHDKISDVIFEAVNKNADLRGTDLNSIDLSGASLCGANLEGADLSKANLYGADLRYANLRGADLNSIDLSHASLCGANLEGANLSKADLYGANLSYADLSHAILRNADLWGANLFAANLYKANLRCADLSYADLRCANLSYADLWGTDLNNADLRGADLTGAKLSWSDLIGANLTGANLTGADLTVADLTGADLALSNLTEVNLTGASGVKYATCDFDGGEKQLLAVEIDSEVRVFCCFFYEKEDGFRKYLETCKEACKESLLSAFRTVHRQIHATIGVEKPTISNEQLAQIVSDCEAEIDSANQKRIDAIAKYVAERGIYNGCRVMVQKDGVAEEREVVLQNPKRDLWTYETKAGEIKVCVQSYPIKKNGEVSQKGLESISVDHVILINKEA